MGCIISPEGVVYGGLDESNHGNFPEFFAMVLSGYKKDIKKSKHKLAKAKKPSQIENILLKVKRRGHTFLKIEQKIYKRIPKKHLLGNVIANLLDSFLPEDLDEFKLFMDGKCSNLEKNYIRDLLADIYCLSRKQITVNSGGKFDRYYPIVNYADCMARYYFNLKHFERRFSGKVYKKRFSYFE